MAVEGCRRRRPCSKTRTFILSRKGRRSGRPLLWFSPSTTQSLKWHSAKSRSTLPTHVHPLQIIRIHVNCQSEALVFPKVCRAQASRTASHLKKRGKQLLAHLHPRPRSQGGAVPPRGAHRPRRRQAAARRRPAPAAQDVGQERPPRVRAARPRAGLQLRPRARLHR